MSELSSKNQKEVAARNQSQGCRWGLVAPIRLFGSQLLESRVTSGSSSQDVVEPEGFVQGIAGLIRTGKGVGFRPGVLEAEKCPKLCKAALCLQAFQIERWVADGPKPVAHALWALTSISLDAGA